MPPLKRSESLMLIKALWKIVLQHPEKILLTIYVKPLRTPLTILSLLFETEQLKNDLLICLLKNVVIKTWPNGKKEFINIQIFRKAV